MKIRVIIEIEVPDGATHYSGRISYDPVWYKQKQRVDGMYWYSCWREGAPWMLESVLKPNWLHKIERAP